LFGKLKSKSKSSKKRKLLHLKVMLKVIYTIFAVGVIGIYAVTTFLGWEFGSSGKNSYFRVPFYSGGYRGGK
jgi:nitrate reductase NapE component